MTHSRRQFLKILAAAPSFLIAGMSVSPVFRYLKPTMKPLGFLDPPDFPVPSEAVSFPAEVFNQPWVCIPFVYKMKISQFNPEKEEVREVLGFMISLGNKEVVAYSRLCPAHGNESPYIDDAFGCCRCVPHKCPLNYLADDDLCHAGCFLPLKDCKCSKKIANPVLYCACTGVTYDLANEARASAGCRQAAQKFILRRTGDTITVEGLMGDERIL